jgi:hypothetical protein
MAKIYKRFTTQERAVVMTMGADLGYTRSIAKRLSVRPAPSAANSSAPAASASTVALGT